MFWLQLLGWFVEIKMEWDHLEIFAWEAYKPPDIWHDDTQV